MNSERSIKYLKDYQPAAYRIEQTLLEFELFEECTLVTAHLQIVPSQSEACPLILDGEKLELLSVQLNDRILSADEYQQTESQLWLPAQTQSFRLILKTRLYPAANTALTGLYQSSGNFCTQCEAEGFRRITYYLDRPDVLSQFTTTIKADKERYPSLLSNGNLIDFGDLTDGRHFATWQDPFPKPCYLFALVAGRFDLRRGEFVTASGNTVKLELYVQPGFQSQTAFAMESLIRAMRWDEETYGREYDLDVYMIVAVDDFNMGAMENKGLNIFNTRYVLADPSSATDDDHIAVEAVIAHEYFHNWTGNRITCRDWFQLSLKEGLTVFRDQQFTADLHGFTVKRINDVTQLRTRQFTEDAGPLAHPVRPESYIEMNNFYTATVYEKGAELIRMLHMLLGPELFRRAMDYYFEQYDGQAVTCEHFMRCMEQASGKDLSQFRWWYSQAGTPCIHVESQYDADNLRYVLSLKQRCPDTPGQSDKQPMLMPVKFGLLAADGKILKLQADSSEQILEFSQAEQQWVFEGIRCQPVPSVFRDFSAPIKLEYDYSLSELAVLFRYDPNQFNRWEAGQKLASSLILNSIQLQHPLEPQYFIDGVAQILQDPLLDTAFKAKAIALPSELYLASLQQQQQPLQIHHVCQQFKRQLAIALEPLLLQMYHQHSTAKEGLEPQAMGERALSNQLLDYLFAVPEYKYWDLVVKQYYQSDNMTQRLSALKLAANCPLDESEHLLQDFESRFTAQPLVMDKWFSLQANSYLPDAIPRLDKLLQHPAFSISNPNKVRAVAASFALQNPVHFHAEDASGYQWLTRLILVLDPVNPQIAARLALALSGWQRHSLQRQQAICACLSQILAYPELSADTFEVVSKSLDSVK